MSIDNELQQPENPKVCIGCGILLDEKMNFYPSYRKYKIWICRDCHRERNKEKQSVRDKIRYQKERIEILAIKKKERLELDEKLYSNFPAKCELCHILLVRRNRALHEINGKKHPMNIVQKLHFILTHRKDFVAICKTCHSGIHFAMKIGFLWEEIKEKFNERNSRKSQ